MLKIMLASCTQAPAEEGREVPKYEASRDNSPRQSTREERPTAAVELSLHRSNSGGVALTLTVSEVASLCLDPNYRATSKVSLLDRSGAAVDAGGFEGRPIARCADVPSSGLLEFAFGPENFRAGAFEQAGRLCYSSWYREGRSERRVPLTDCIELDRDT